jgi:hypothetical protein
MASLRSRPYAYDPLTDVSIRSAAVALYVLCGMVVVLNPVTLVPGLALLGIGWIVRPPRWMLWTLCAICLAAVLAVHSDVAIGWFWRLQFAHSFPTTPFSITGAVAIDLLVGPIVLLGVLTARAMLDRTLVGQLRFHRLEAFKRFDAVRGRVNVGPTPRADQVPPGFVRLGQDVENRRHFDLALSELDEHVFIPGASGSGKTTTVARIADGVAGLGYGVVIVDCKGGDLKEISESLARRHRLAFHLVDPDDPKSLGYDACSGSPADVSNKLVGIFDYGGAAQIYKNAAQQVIPLVARGLQESGRRVTLTALTDAIVSPPDLRRLGREAGGESETRLNRLADQMHPGSLTAEAYAGLGLRFGALLEGSFRELLLAVDEDRPTLDWDAAVARPSVTYIALRATASGEDVDLMSRMIAQDLKQVCARRIRAHAEGTRITPVLCVMDEFAALNEARQFRDLLLQARQALLPTVIATQILPESADLLGAAMGSGLIIAHRLAGDDAEAMANQFGTRVTWKETIQHDVNKGATGLLSIREVNEFNVHPDHFRQLHRGRAAVRSVSTDRRAILQIYQTEIARV